MYAVFRSVALGFAVVSFASSALGANPEHAKHITFSCSKPSAESHTWSYGQACRQLEQKLEALHGVDFKIVDLKFEDLGRETKTEKSFGKRKWRCDHKVTATYKVARRGAEDDSHKL